MTSLEINNATIELLSGDITDQKVDAMVNAANSRLAGGGGVDGAIHRRGGPEIMAETDRRYPDGCPTGSAVITGGGNLTAKFVIHAVGPLWSGGEQSEDALLTSAYRSCLELAVKNGCYSIAFPSLSTGAYRFPLKRAAEIALSTVAKFLQENGRPQTVRFALWGDEAMAAFTAALGQIGSDSKGRKAP